MSGANTFINNSSPEGYGMKASDCICNLGDDYYKYHNRGSGGAIHCIFSTLNINSEYTTFANNIAQDSGGAIAAIDGSITIKGSITFTKNIARYEGGAIYLRSTTLIICENFSFINNKAHRGGALSLFGVKLLILSEDKLSKFNYYNSIFSNSKEFCMNLAINGGVPSKADEKLCWSFRQLIQQS